MPTLCILKLYSLIYVNPWVSNNFLSMCPYDSANTAVLDSAGKTRIQNNPFICLSSVDSVSEEVHWDSSNCISLISALCEYSLLICNEKLTLTSGCMIFDFIYTQIKKQNLFFISYVTRNTFNRFPVLFVVSCPCECLHTSTEWNFPPCLFVFHNQCLVSRF